MADSITHQLYPDIQIHPESGRQKGSSPYWDYKITVDGKQIDLPSALTIDPQTLRDNINNDKHAAYHVLNTALKHVKGGSRHGVSADRSLFSGTISPALQRSPGALLGAPADIANLALQGLIDAPINIFNWAFGGFEGEVPSKRYVSSEVPVGGSEFIARRMHEVGDLARKGIAATEEAGLNVTVPEYIPVLGGTRVGARTLLEPVAFDTKPDKSTRFKKYVALITEMVGAAPMEGVTIARLATHLSNTTKNATAQNVYDAISEMQVNNPKAAAAYESIMGGAVGGGMITSEAALEEVYPNAPQWMKNIVMAGGGLAFPLVGQTTLTTGYDVGLKVPVVRIPLKILQGGLESLTLKGAERAASRAVQTSTGTWRDRSGILGVVGQLRLALKEGRNMDETTRIEFTTTQLARNEARVLEAQLKGAAHTMSEEEVASVGLIIKELRQFADFQEGQLKTISEKGGIAAQTYASHSGRMMDRRDSILKALDETIFKTDLGGKLSEGVEPSVIEADYQQGLGTGSFEYNINRQKAFKEGRLGALEPEQTAAIANAFEDLSRQIEGAAEQAIRDAEERVMLIRKGMPEEMSTADRDNYNQWIRREFENAYLEVDALEDILWNSIRGMEQPKTGSYIDPDGVDLGPQLLIDGVPITEHFAAIAARVSATAGESQNQTKWLWKLAGRDALVEQAAKGGGADAEKIAKQNAQIRQWEDIVVERERQVEVASQNLARVKETPSASTALRNARAEVAKLEAELGEIPKGSTIEDPTVIRRINAVNQKLTGARAKVAELEASEPSSAALTKATKTFEDAHTNLNKAQISLNSAKDNLEISLGDGVTHQGSPINVANELMDAGALGVRNVDGVLTGRTGQEINNIIGHLKRESAFESSRGNVQKVSAISRIIEDLQKALPENFDIDMPMYDAGIKMTRLKKTLFSTGAVGQIRAYDRRGQPVVSPEKVIDQIAPSSKRAAQETNLRQIETALAARYDNMTGEGTPFRITEDGTPELNPDFNIEKYSQSYPPPFESIQIDGSGRVQGFKLAEGTQATPETIELVRNTLWDRFQAYGVGDEFDVNSAQKWIEKNKAAIEWLRKATGKDTGFENIVSAERIVQTIKSATQKNIEQKIRVLREEGAFNDEFTESGLRTLIKENNNREAALLSAANILGNPDPINMGDFFLRKFLSPDNANPTQFLNETLKVLEKGVLPSGKNPALEGFKQAVAEAIIRATVTSADSNSAAAVNARRLSSHLGENIKLWDPQKFIALSENPSFGRLLNQLYGENAPELFSKIAIGARDQFVVSESATPGVKRQDKVSGEWAGNFGRILGGLSSRFLPISALVLTGMGRRYGMAAISDYRGSVIDKLIVDMLMDPKLAIEAINKNPVKEVTAETGLAARVKLWAHEKFIGDNARRIRRLGQAPGVLYETGEPTKYEEMDEPGSVGPQSSVAPAAPRSVRYAMRNARPSAPVVQVSSLAGAGARPLGASAPPASSPQAAPPANPQQSTQTLARMSQLGIPLFRGNHGGYVGGAGSGVGRLQESEGIMSVRRKGRQLVG